MSAENQDNQSSGDNAGVKFPPPLIPLIFIGVGYGLQRLQPLGMPGSDDWRITGWVIIAVGVALLVSGQIQFKKHKTDIRPDQPASMVIRGGPYRFSRNPLYLAFLVIQTGAGVLMGNPWVILFMPLTMWTISKYVIPREEAYMERAFGDDYLALKSEVRRWL